MAPYLSTHITSETFVMNSDVDHWQMNNILQALGMPGIERNFISHVA